MRLLNLAAQVEYVHEDDRTADGTPAPDATVWLLRCLTNSEKGALDDSMMDFSKSRVSQGTNGKAVVDMGMTFSVSERRNNRVRIGVVGWRNLLDAEGNELPFSTEAFTVGNKTFKGMPMAVLEALPQTVLKDLSREVGNLSGMSVAEGNF